jgi:hypothetical protein
VGSFASSAMPIAAISRNALSVVGLAVVEVSNRRTLEALADPTNTLTPMALWKAEWLVKTEGGERSVPAFDYLLDQPSAVRVQLLAIATPPRSPYPTTSPARCSRQTTGARPKRATRAGIPGSPIPPYPVAS